MKQVGEVNREPTPAQPKWLVLTGSTKEGCRFTAAVAAMQGILSTGWTDDWCDGGYVAHHAVNIADALLTELSKND